MQIELTKEEYKTLLRSIDVASFVYGVMGDMVDEKYKKQSKEIENLTDKVLEKADEYGVSEFVENFDGKNILSDDYSNEILYDVTEYEEYSFWDNLARKLAIKEMQQKYSQEEREKMEEVEFVSEVWELEEKYYKILEKSGIENFELNKS